MIARLLLASLLVLAPATPGGAFEFASAAFAPGGEIPARYTCMGRNVSPPLHWSSPPAGTRSLVLVVEDPDAIAGTWVHWILYAIPATLRRLAPAVPARDRIDNIGIQGVNTFGRTGWSGPC